MSARAIFSSDKLKIAAVFFLVTALIASLIFVVIQDDQKWEAFKVKHGCKVVSNIKGDVFNTFGTSGGGNMIIGIGSTPEKEGWLCDDSMTYYR